MKARLTQIDRGETLKYLQHRGGDIPDDISADIDRCEAGLIAVVRPRAVWRFFQLLPDGRLAGTDFRPAGEDIRSFLRGCGSVILMAATLGAESEILLRQTQLRSLADAVIMDAAASAAIENVCDNLCADLAEIMAPLCLTDRFSPGYGDMPLSQQEELCRVLDVGRRIGVNLSESALMIPQKSVTALIGVSERPGAGSRRGCALCDRFENCLYRKEGTDCGNP